MSKSMSRIGRSGAEPARGPSGQLIFIRRSANHPDGPRIRWLGVSPILCIYAIMPMSIPRFHVSFSISPSFLHCRLVPGSCTERTLPSRLIPAAVARCYCHGRLPIPLDYIISPAADGRTETT